MDLEKFVKLYSKKNGVIIKRNLEKLDFTIRIGLLFVRDLKISVDDENLCIGKKTIKIKDLKRIYIFTERYFSRANPALTVMRVHWLTIVEKNNRTYRINLNDLSENNLDKIGKLFRHFIFSNETDHNRLSAKNYEFLITDNSKLYKHKLHKYNEEQENAQIINLYSKEYSFMGVLPKKYYKKYLKKEYLLFETKYKNSNYMDVWTCEIKDKDKTKKQNLWLLIIALLLLIITTFCLQAFLSVLKFKGYY